MKRKKFKTFVLIGVLIPVAVFFQNCSDFTLQDSLIYDQALASSREAMDAELLPSLLSSENIKFWSRVQQPDVITTGTTIFGDQWSFIVAANVAIRGKILSVRSGSGVEEGYIEVVDGLARAVRYQQTPLYRQTLEVPLPKSGNNFVFAVAFSEKKDGITALMNGLVQNAAIQNQGSAGDFSYVARSLVVTDPMTMLLEYVVFVGDSQGESGALSKKQLNVMSRYVANSQMIPDVVFDTSLLNNESPTTPGTGESPQFLAAKAIFDSKCLNCHKTGGNSPNLVNMTETKAFSNGWAIAKNPAASMLYNKLQGAGGTMPIGGSMTAGELQTVADWINSK